MDGKTDREEEKLEEEKLQEAGPDSAEDGFVSEEEPETETPPRKSMGEKIRGLLTKGIGRYTVAGWLAIICLAGVFVYSAVSLGGRGLQDKRNREIQERNASLGERTETAAVSQDAGTQVTPETGDGTVTAEPAVTPLPEHTTQRAEALESETVITPVVGTPRPTATLAPMATPQVVRERFAQLVQMNPDTAGWLKVDCLYRINFVVVQGKNSYYMDHDFDGMGNVNGTAFLDEQCSLSRHPENYMIFGHNMKTGDMFGELHQISDRGKLKANFLTHFDTLYEDADYVPVAAGRASLVPESDRYFPFFVSRFENETDFNHYIEQARSISEIDLPVDVRYGDQLLTLVTCTGDDTERYIALFRKVRSGEDVSGYADRL